jgi:hypothetical protein
MRGARKGAVERRIAAQRTQVRCAVGVLVREFLDAGVPFDKAVDNAALGSLRIHEILAARGAKISRRTVHTRLNDLYGSPVGQMPAHLRDFSSDMPLKVLWIGANTYSLYRDRSRTGQRLIASLGRHARARQRWVPASACLVRLRRDNYYCSNRGVVLRANLVEQIVGGLLVWAVSHAEGQRNNIGNWLSWRCRAKGLDRDEVEEVIERYQEEVCWLGSHPYTRREAIATVRSAFRR